MGKGDLIQFGAVLGAIAVGVFIAIALTDIATINAAWCDARPACLRSWIGALSGWAAAIAAGATILFLRSESIKRDRLDWRDVVHSAELLRGWLAPHVEQLGTGLQTIEENPPPAWMAVCLERIEDVLGEQSNLEYRRASVIVSARHSVCMRVTSRSKDMVRNRANRLLSEFERRHIQLTHQELVGLIVELKRVVDSAFDPASYRGV